MIESRFLLAVTNCFAVAVLASMSINARGQEPKKEIPEKAAGLTPPSKEYAQEYVQSFRTAAKTPGWELEGPLVENCVKFEDAGLRITLPAGWDAERKGTGIKSNFQVKGDFEITLGFEVLDEPGADDAGKGGTRLSLAVFKDTQKTNVATINRSVGAQGSNFVSWAFLWNNTANKHLPSVNVVATKTKVGRLRLVRVQDHLHFALGEGFDEEPKFKTKFLFGNEDLRDVRITASTGGVRAALDVRVTDFRIRADAIPNMPAGAPAAPVAPAHLDAAPPAGSRGWLMAAALIGGSIALVFVVAMVAGLVLLRRRSVPESPVKQGVKKKG